MSHVGVRRLSKKIDQRLEGFLDRSKSVRAFLIRNIYPMYQNVQAKRWKTENASEGGKWQPLESGYEARKKTQFAQYPGAGKKMLIAKYKLFPSVIGPGNGFRMVVDDTKLFLYTSTPYAEYVNAKRPFDTYTKATRAKFRRALKDYIINNKISLNNEFL